MWFALFALLLVVATPASATTWPELASITTPTGEGRADAVVLIAIEDYVKVDDVVGARRNADDWMRWFVVGRGVPASRVFKAYDSDATDIQMRELAARASAAVQPGGTLWFVYIGHGAPSKDGSDGLLVGADADRSAQGIYQRSVSRTEMLSILERGKQAQTVAFLDACFSGQSASGNALVSGLQPLVPTALLAQTSARTRILTAAASGEFSGPLPGASRPAFSYLALGGLMGWADHDGVGNGDGKVSAEELREYVAGALNLTVEGRTQTPTLLGQDGVLGRAVASKPPDLMPSTPPTVPVVMPASVAAASPPDVATTPLVDMGERRGTPATAAGARVARAARLRRAGWWSAAGVGAAGVGTLAYGAVEESAITSGIRDGSVSLLDAQARSSTVNVIYLAGYGGLFLGAGTAVTLFLLPSSRTPE